MGIKLNKIHVTGTDKNGCSSKDSTLITVFTTPDVSLKSELPICEDSISFQIVPTVSGGIFSGGPFVTNTGLFSPPTARAGLHWVFYERNVSGCYAKDSILITINPVPVPKVIIDPLAGCEPLEVKLASRSGDTPLWRLNGSFLSDKDSLNKVFMQGLHNIKLTLTNTFGCNTDVNTTITVQPKPAAAFSYIPKDDILARITLVQFINQSKGNGLSSKWFIDTVLFNTNTNASHNFNDTGYYNITLVVKNTEGCSDTSDAKLYVIDEFRVFLPTAITPNGDGLNDLFFPGGIGIDSVNLQIYNRWGEKIHDSNKPWDGTYKGTVVQDGNYPYFMTIKDAQGYKHFLKGIVTVLR